MSFVLRLLDRTAQWRDVRVDVSSRTFRLGDDGASEPVDLLLKRLGWAEPAPPFTLSSQRRRAATAMAFAGAFVCVLFVAGGAWMALAETTSKDLWTGVAGAAFFALCAWVDPAARRSLTTVSRSGATGAARRVR